MAVDFPSSPTLNEKYTYNGTDYIWDGEKWVSGGATVFATKAVATTDDDGLMSSEDKVKLDGIEAGASVAPVESVNGKTGAVVLDSDDVGAPSDAEFATLEGRVLANEVAQGNNLQKDAEQDGRLTALESDVSGIDTALDSKADLVNGVIPTSQIPSIAITEFLGDVSSEAEMLALTGQPGDWCFRSDEGFGYVIIDTPPSVISSWQQIATPGGDVNSVNGQTGTVVLSAADVGAIPATELPNLAPATVDLQAVTDNGSTTTNSATFGGAVQSGGDPNDGTAAGAKMLQSGVVQATRASGSSTSAVYMGYLQGDATPTSRINADGSASFAGRVDVLGGVTVDGGSSISTGLYYRDDSEQYGLALYSQGSAANNRKVFIKTDGSASFAGVVSTDDRLVCNASGKKSNDGVAFLMYQQDGATDAVSITAGGSATFASSVTCQGYVDVTRENNSAAFQVNLTGTGATARIFGDGSVDFAAGGTFGSTVIVNNNPATGAVGAAMYTNGNMLSISDQANCFEWGNPTDNVLGVLKGDGSVDLNSNIVLNANDGSASFAGLVECGDTTTAYGVIGKNSAAGGNTFQAGGLFQNYTAGGSAIAVIPHDYVAGQQATAYIREDGSASFAAGNTRINSVGSVLIGTTSDLVTDAKIAFDAGSGSASFATGAVSVDPAGYISVNRTAASNIIEGKLNGTQTSVIKADGSADFDGNVIAANITLNYSNGTVLDVRERLTDTVNALTSLKTAAAAATSLEDLKEAIANALTSF